MSRTKVYSIVDEALVAMSIMISDLHTFDEINMNCNKLKGAGSNYLLYKVCVMILLIEMNPA